MNLDTFLVFPGILVTIGVFLLLCSIILIIIAYKTSGKSSFEVPDKKSKKKNKKQIKEKPVIEEKSNDLDKTKVFDFSNELKKKEKPQEFIKLKPVKKEEIIEKDNVKLLKKDIVNDDEEIELL